MIPAPAQLQEFLTHRPMLFGLAYRVLGSAHDAEDVLQEAYLRWSRADRTAVEQPRRYLTRVVARLAVDQLRARQARRESYPGEWLPEPVATDPSPFGAVDTSDLSIAVLHLMEQLTPPQRAVYVLRTAFELPYAEIATILERSPQDCRQLYRRAATALHERRPRFTPTPGEQHRLLVEFVAAARAGETDRLRRLLRDDVVAWSDGGGRVQAALRPIRSAAKVARFYASIYSRIDALTWEPVHLNGGSALLVAGTRRRYALFLDTALGAGPGGVVASVYLIANPDKLGALDRR